MSQKTCECESPSFYTHLLTFHLCSPLMFRSGFRTRTSTPNIVGDPMVKTAFEALDWALISGGKVAPTHPQAAPPLNLLFDASIFSSALKRVSTVSVSGVDALLQELQRRSRERLRASKTTMTRHIHGSRGATAVCLL